MPEFMTQRDEPAKSRHPDTQCVWCGGRDVRETHVYRCVFVTEVSTHGGLMVRYVGLRHGSGLSDCSVHCCRWTPMPHLLAQHGWGWVWVRHNSSDSIKYQDMLETTVPKTGQTQSHCCLHFWQGYIIHKVIFVECRLDPSRMKLDPVVFELGLSLSPLHPESSSFSNMPLSIKTSSLGNPHHSVSLSHSVWFSAHK